MGMGCSMHLATCKEICDLTIEPSPKVALRVLYAPTERSLGARVLGLSGGTQLTVMHLDKEKGLDPLGWRFDRCRRGSSQHHGASAGTDPCIWPEGYRCDVPRVFWRATFFCMDNSGHMCQCRSVLQVAAPHVARGMDKASIDVSDSTQVASYATRFNKWYTNFRSASEEEKQLVTVAAPVVCEVEGSALPQFIFAGNIVLLYPYEHAEVRKFVFTGKEDFHDTPQAFFHYVDYASAGRETVLDLQGMVEPDGRTLLIDPCIVRQPLPSVGDVVAAISAIATEAIATEVPMAPVQVQRRFSGSAQERFKVLHPTCGQMCQGLENARKGTRVNCGFVVRACGV